MTTGSATHQPAAAGNKLYIRYLAKLKQDRIVALCPDEVGWVGTVKQHGSALVVEDIFVPKQEVSGTSVDVEPDDYGIASLMEEYPDEVQYMRYFGHSHVNMSSYFSSVDTGQIEDWRKYGLTWCINHVQNKKGESKTRFDMFEPFHFAIDIPQVITTIPAQIEEWVEKELEEKVSKKTYSSSSVSRIGHSSHQGGTGYGQHEVARRTGNYTSWIQNVKKEFVNHYLILEESLANGWRKLYDVETGEVHEFTDTKNADGATKHLMRSTERRMREKARTWDPQNVDGKKEVIRGSEDEPVRAEGKAQSPSQQKLLGPGSQDGQPQTPTASDRKSEKSGSESEQPRRLSSRVRELLTSDDEVSEADALRALYVDGEMVEMEPVDISEDPDDRWTQDHQDDYEAQLLAAGFGLAHIAHLMN